MKLEITLLVHVELSFSAQEADNPRDLLIKYEKIRESLRTSIGLTQPLPEGVNATKVLTQIMGIDAPKGETDE